MFHFAGAFWVHESSWSESSFRWSVRWDGYFIYQFQTIMLKHFCILFHRSMQEAFQGLFPKDNPKNTRFAINFFTSIGLGGIT